MPKYVCDECGKVFQSKDALESHSHDSRSLSRFSGFEVPSLTLRQIAVLFGVFLMGTLFMGTAFFASSIGPSSQNGDGTTSAQETTPPTGYTVRSEGDIPQVSRSEIPEDAVVETEISHDVQVFLLARSTVLLQYSCTGCSGTVQELSSIAEEYNTDQTWVYVAPYSGMDSKIAATGFQRGPLNLEEVDTGELERFICTALQDRPIQCALQ